MTELSEIDPYAKALALGRDNDARIAAFGREGIQIEPLNLLSMRLAALSDRLLGKMDGPVPGGTRALFELELQQKYATMLDEVQSQVTRARLLQGVTLKP